MRKLMLFHARYCGKCHAADKRLKKYLEKPEYSFEYELVDIETQKDVADKYQVESIPVLIAFENGVEIKRVKGTILPTLIEELLE